MIKCKSKIVSFILVVVFIASAFTNAFAASAADYTLPESYNSADLGYVTPMQEQEYNDCWAYASLATFETRLLMDGVDVSHFSVPHMNKWATPETSGIGWARDHYMEAYTETALGYLTSGQGIVSPDEAPKDLILALESSDSLHIDTYTYAVTDVEVYPKKDAFTDINVNDIKSGILSCGGVYSSFLVNTKCLSSNKNSYFYTASDMDENTGGHAVEIIGWDNSYAKENFDTKTGKMPENDGAWLIKNSWGTTYNSNEGYLWISYEDEGLFTVGTSYSIIDYIKYESNQTLLKNEDYGAISDFYLASDNEVSFINIYDFSNSNVINKIMFSRCTNVPDSLKYELFYVPVKDNVPSSDRTEWMTLYKGEMTYSGYVGVDIGSVAVPKGVGAIAITFEGVVDEFSEIPVYWAGTTNYWRDRFNYEAPLGVSFVLDGDNLYDVNAEDEYGFVNNAIFSIKVLSSSPDEVLGDVNLDFDVNVKDATLIQKHIAKLTEIIGDQLALADVNSDGEINVKDATAIQKFVAKIETGYPIGKPIL